MLCCPFLFHMQDQLPKPSPIDFLRLLTGKRRAMRVRGRSMLPLLPPGDIVFLDPTAYQECQPEPGDIVVAHRPDQPETVIIKRVVGFTENDHIILMGDNPSESTDSRKFGPISTSLILGKVISRW